VNADAQAEFNPLRHPVLFNAPQLLSIQSKWVAHIPLAYLLIDLVRPRLFVELGTQHGDSYCAFCQGVADLGSPTRCVAVDNWLGDEETGEYDANVLATLKAHHDPNYGEFSTLMQREFDDAVTQFEDGSIDLLHLDGRHTYEAVRHDFETWLPKMSPRGVVLFHGSSARHEPGWGVWRFWEVLSWQHPSFEIPHGHGIGIVAVGDEPPENLLAFLNGANAEPTVTRQFFEEMGERIVSLQALLRTTQRMAAQWSVLSHWRRATLQGGLPQLDIAELFGDPEPLARALLEEVARLAQDDINLRQGREPMEMPEREAPRPTPRPVTEPAAKQPPAPPASQSPAPPTARTRARPRTTSRSNR
jgi:hypothetical protein